jgi:hypothetical protein
MKEAARLARRVFNEQRYCDGGDPWWSIGISAARGRAYAWITAAKSRDPNVAYYRPYTVRRPSDSLGNA